MQIETGFVPTYEVKNIRSIKAVNSGEYQGNKFNASIQFKAVNVEQVEDPELGLTERETIMIFKVPCEDKNLKKFNNFLRQMQKNHESLILTASLPRDAGKDSYQVTSFETAEQIMEMYAQKKKPAA